MAKILAYEDEARQKLASGVGKLARAVRSTLGPRGRNAVIDKGWGSPDRDQGRRDRGRGDRADRSLREHGGSARQGSGLQDFRRGRRRHDHRDRAGRGDLQGGPQGPGRRRRSDGPEAGHRQGRRGHRRERQGPSPRRSPARRRSPRSPRSPPTTTARSARSWPTPSRRSAPTASSPSRRPRASRRPSTWSRACSSTAAS